MCVCMNSQEQIGLDNPQELVLSYYVGAKVRTQVLGLDNKRPRPLSHLAYSKDAF